MKTNCAYCGKEIDRRPCVIARNSRCYCNVSHQLKYEYTNGVRDKYKIGIVARKVAQKKMNKHNWLNDKESRDRLREVMQTERYKEKQRQPKSSHFKVGHIPWSYIDGKKYWKGAEWNRIKKLIKIRDGFECQSCGRTEEDNLRDFRQPLQVHHLIPYRVCKEHKPKNLITLCNRCHGLCVRQDILLIRVV